MNDYAYHLWSRVGGDRFNRGDEWGTFPRTARFLKRLLAAYKRSRQRALAIRELSRLTERQLADIGIERGQIPVVVEGLFAREENAGSPRPHPAKRTAGTAAPGACASPC